MKESANLKSHDIAIAIKILLMKKEDWRQVDISYELGLSQSEIAKSLKRLNFAGIELNRRINKTALLDLILHGVKYIYPTKPGALGLGLPTSISAPAHKKAVVNDTEVFVWPSANGEIRGQIIDPFYKNIADAAIKDADFYDIMSAIDILRIGKSREKSYAEKFIEKKIGSL